MASRRRRLACVALCVVVTVGARAQGPNQHRGQVVIAGREEEGVFAQVTAYESDTPPNKQPGCPKFDKQLTQVNSDKADGRFTLTLGPTPPSYVVTYCAGGYVPRVDRALQNVPNEPVLPKPVPLVQTNAKADEMMRILGAEFRSFTSNISYFRQANPDAFNDAITSAFGRTPSPQEKELIEAVRRLVNVPTR